MAVITGRIRKFGNNIDTDSITPAVFLRTPIEEQLKKAFSPITPDFYQTVQPGDILVAGDNFGCGSSREQATQVVKAMGIKYIVCQSMARIYFRNCIAVGVFPIISQGVSELFNEGDQIEIDTEKNKIKNIKTAKSLPFQPIPEAIAPILAVGGILEYLKQKM
jgi:3-isopropylmalate/(R)-2-methylmalate dehydratase small subunit